MFWTVRLAAACYVVSVLVQVGRRERWRRFARRAWTAGCVLLWFHVAAALHVVYGWDHARMVRETARQSLELTGVRFAAAAYVNYAVMLLWAADAAYWNAAGDARYRRRPRWTSIIVHAPLAFVAFNAAVVFATTRWVQWAGVLACAAVGVALTWRLAKSRLDKRPPDSTGL